MSPVLSKPRVASLFSGIGGFERGFEAEGWSTELQCEVDPAARFVLEKHFDAPIHDDISTLESLPDVECVVGGFPCTNLSQAGNKSGISGDASGLVDHVFRLLGKQRVPWVVLENVKNMVVLHDGEAMKVLTSRLEELGYRWAYRTVDARSFGLAQRRERVIFVASLHGDPACVLFADEGQSNLPSSGDAYGFYWNMGERGVGWAVDVVPPIKGIDPSLWIPGGKEPLVRLTPHAGEVLQGFPRGWTDGSESALRRTRERWRLIGNAIPVPIAQWVARGIINPRDICVDSQLQQGKWTAAGQGGPGLPTLATKASQFPLESRARPILSFIEDGDLEPMTPRAANGFYTRYKRGSLKLDSDFLTDVRICALGL